MSFDLPPMVLGNARRQRAALGLTWPEYMARAYEALNRQTAASDR